MKLKYISIFFLSLFLVSCTSQKKLAYLNNLPETVGDNYFPMDIPEYKIQPRDILYITAKALTQDGTIKDLMSPGLNSGILTQVEAGGAFIGYTVDPQGFISLVPVGQLKVNGFTLEETRHLLQESIGKVFKNITVECRLLSFKFTVIGEVKQPGAYLNYNNYLTVLEAIGRAGGISDYGNRTNVLVIRPMDNGTKTFRLNLQSKDILTSEAYFLLPNDLIIVEPVKQKIFNMNLPTVSFIISAFTSALTTTLLLINYLK